MIMDLRSVKHSLERERCRVHGNKPEITVVGQSLNFKCCCDKFKSELVKKSEILIAQQAKSDIENSLKNLFR